MRQVLIRRGAVEVAEVPAPGVRPGAVLVRVAYSAISAGTESAWAASLAEPLWRRVLRDPGTVRRAWRRVRAQGLRATADAVRASRDVGHPSGYSCAGRVVAVGDGVEDLRPGDAVACAGAQFAHHAEVVCVPRNLVAAVPTGCSLRDAAAGTLGAIALQGVRRAEPALGETAVVIGLGGLGLLSVQLLRAAGARVAAVDLDPRRVGVAAALGAEWAVRARRDEADVDGADPVTAVVEATGGAGADLVLVAAATPSDRPMLEAMHMARKKGRVVIVGDVGLALAREPFYLRELDLRISTSYGPGRYDSSYEDEGLDYPYAYVRWTENRNLGEFLRLVAVGTVRLDPLVDSVRPVVEAPAAFAALSGAEPRPLLSLLRYDAPDGGPGGRTVERAAKPAAAGTVRLALVGAGEFARGVLLPAIQATPGLACTAVAARQGHVAEETARACGAALATTDVAALLARPDVDAVCLATRHDSHADLVAAAAAARKAIWCEKPLALDEAGLGRAVDAVRAAGVPLVVGFNRRFAPHVAALAERLAGRRGPCTMVYRVNAGRLPAGHWALGPEGGGRAVGEACHMVDLLTALAGGVPRLAGVAAGRPAVPPAEEFAASLEFPDGSVATLVYTALGHAAAGKEWLEVHAGGRTYVLDDFRSLHVDGRRVGPRLGAPDKGHRVAVARFVACCRGEAPPPADLDTLAAVTRVTFAIRDALAGARAPGA